MLVHRFDAVTLFLPILPIIWILGVNGSYCADHDALLSLNEPLKTAYFKRSGWQSCAILRSMNCSVHDKCPCAIQQKLPQIKTRISCSSRKVWLSRVSCANQWAQFNATYPIIVQVTLSPGPRPLSSDLRAENFDLASVITFQEYFLHKKKLQVVNSLLSGSFLIKFSSLSAPTKIEELTAGSDEKTQRSPAGNIELSGWSVRLEFAS